MASLYLFKSYLIPHCNRMSNNDCIFHYITSCDDEQNLPKKKSQSLLLILSQSNHNCVMTNGVFNGCLGDSNEGRMTKSTTILADF